MNEAMKVIVKKKLLEEGLSEEEAERIVADMDKSGETLDKLGKFAQAAEILSNAPQEARPALVPVAQSIITGEDDDVMKDIKKMILQMKALELAFGNKDSQQQEVISKILQELEDMKERALEAEMQKKEEAMEALRQELSELKDLMASVIMRGEEKSTSTEEKKDITERIAEDLEYLQRTKEMLKQLGMIKEGGGEQIDKEKIIEMLRKEGYKIEGPPSWEVIEHKLQEMMKKKEEEIRKQVEEELGVKKEKARMAFDFILSLVEGAMSALNTQSGKGELSGIADKLKAALTGGAEGGGEESKQA